MVVAGEFCRFEKRGCSGSGECHFDSGCIDIELKAGIMSRLHGENPASNRIVSRNHQSALRFPKLSLTKHQLQLIPQRVAREFRAPEDLLDCRCRSLHEAGIGEDDRTLFLVEIGDLPRRKSQS